MKLDCVRCNKCGKVHSVEKGCDLPEANVQPQLYEVRTDGICFICKKPTQNLSPDPTNWRIDLPFNGGDGLTRQYHQGCLVALIDKHFV
jgi:hypothetical protein